MSYQYPDQDARDPQPAMKPAMTEDRRDTIHDLLWKALTALYDGKPEDMQAAIEEANAEALCAIDEVAPPAGARMLEARCL